MNRKCLILAAIAAAVLLCHPAPGYATGLLGSAQNFSVLGASTVTSTGPTTLFGDLGLYPGPSITGFAISPVNTVVGPGTLINGLGLVTGTIYITDPVAQQAQADALTAYNTLAGLSPGSTVVAGNLTGLTLVPGVYLVPAATTNLAGTLILDGQGNANAQWVFQMASTLITSSGSIVNVTNTGAGAGVYWQVGSSATLGTSTVFAGNIIADQSITLTTNANILCGRAIALHAAVTMDTNQISNNNFLQDYGSSRPDYESYGFSGGSGQPTSVIPEPITLGGLFLGVGTLCGYVRRRARR